MTLNQVSPQPISEPDTSTDYTSTTPTVDDEDIHHTIQAINSSVPWPGSTYIIRAAGSANVLSLLNGNVVLASPGSRGATHWECTESGGWLGFKEPASGKFLGFNFWGKLCCTGTKQLAWENFCARMRPDGGYVLLMTHWERLWPVGWREEFGKQILSKVDKAAEDGIVWDFMKVG